MNTFFHLPTNAFQAGRATTAFFHKVLDRVKSASKLSLEAGIANLDRARNDLKRLGSIDPANCDSAAFAELYILGQSLIVKCLASEFLENLL